MTDASRDDHVYMAKLAEQAERYDGMFFHTATNKKRHIFFPFEKNEKNSLAMCST
jgi:hypothetical protein